MLPVLGHWPLCSEEGIYSVILKSIVGSCSIQEFFFTSHLIILCKLVLSSCFKPSALSPPASYAQTRDKDHL